MTVTVEAIEREMSNLAAMGVCCNFSVAYLMAGGLIPDEVMSNVAEGNALWAKLEQAKGK